MAKSPKKSLTARFGLPAVLVAGLGGGVVVDELRDTGEPAATELSSENILDLVDQRLEPLFEKSLEEVLDQTESESAEFTVAPQVIYRNGPNDPVDKALRDGWNVLYLESAPIVQGAMKSMLRDTTTNADAITHVHSMAVQIVELEQSLRDLMAQVKKREAVPKLSARERFLQARSAYIAEREKVQP